MQDNVESNQNIIKGYFEHNWSPNLYEACNIEWTDVVQKLMTSIKTKLVRSKQLSNKQLHLKCTSKVQKFYRVEFVGEMFGWSQLFLHV